MSLNCRRSVDSGNFRKNHCNEEFQELLVFGYSCKLFRDDERAILIDQGKHLIPWMGDKSLKIDRYDARGALGDLQIHEPSSDGYDLESILSDNEKQIEALCDEERYRFLYKNEVDKTLYEDSRIQRDHLVLDSEDTYSKIEWNYKKDLPNSQQSKESFEKEEPFHPDSQLKIPDDIITPDTQKLNAIITKTAQFISHQGGQMEVLIKAKQSDNPQFSFLSVDGVLNPYYKYILEAIKSGNYNPEKEPEKIEMDTVEESEEENSESYLHPSLATSLKVETAPSIPNIIYKPSEGCSYSMLVNKITGKTSFQIQQPEAISHSLVPLVNLNETKGKSYSITPRQYIHGPVIYNSHQDAISVSSVQIERSSPNFSNKNGISQSQVSLTIPKDYPSTKPLHRPPYIIPPADVQVIIDKMASYVAKNGRDFEIIVKNKGDPRFNFLELSHQYHGYYIHKLTIYESDEYSYSSKVLTEESLSVKQKIPEEKINVNEWHLKQKKMEEVYKRVKIIQKKKEKKKQPSPNTNISTVCFSIKNPKEGENSMMEKKNALLQEESDEDKIQTEIKTKSHLESLKTFQKNEILKTEKEQSNSVDEIPLMSYTKTTIVDLTDDVLESSHEKILEKQSSKARDNISGISMASKEKQLQMERRKKAAMFLSKIKTSIADKADTQKLEKENCEQKSASFFSSSTNNVDIQETRCSYILSNKLEKIFHKEEINKINQDKRTEKIDRIEKPKKEYDTRYFCKKPKYHSRSRSRSLEFTDRQKSHNHKKHKKKKNYHKRSSENLSCKEGFSSRYHKSKKSKKSYCKHRSQSRSSHKRYTSSNHSKVNIFSDSESSA